MEVENKRNGSEKFEYSLKSSKIPSETKIYSWGKLSILFPLELDYYGWLQSSIEQYNNRARRANELFIDFPNFLKLLNLFMIQEVLSNCNCFLYGQQSTRAKTIRYNYLNKSRTFVDATRHVPMKRKQGIGVCSYFIPFSYSQFYFILYTLYLVLRDCDRGSLNCMEWTVIFHFCGINKYP